MYIDSPLWKREQQIENLERRDVATSNVENRKENNETIELQASALYRIASKNQQHSK